MFIFLEIVENELFDFIKGGIENKFDSLFSHD